MKMKMAIASIQGLFAGKVKIEDQNPPHSFKLIGGRHGQSGIHEGQRRAPAHAP